MNALKQKAAHQKPMIQRVEDQTVISAPELPPVEKQKSRQEMIDLHRIYTSNQKEFDTIVNARSPVEQTPTNPGSTTTVSPGTASKPENGKTETKTEAGPSSSPSRQDTPSESHQTGGNSGKDSGGNSGKGK